MKRASIAFMTLLCCSPAFAQESNSCDTVQPNYIITMPGFAIKDCEYSEFNTIQFQYEKVPGKVEDLTSSGLYRKITYERPNDEARKISGIQIRANYANAVIKAKGEVLSHRQDFFRLKQDGRHIYIFIKYAEDNNDFGYVLEIIEESKLKQEVDINLKDLLNTEGRVSMYGILFDIDKSVIKPESESALKMISDYLKSNPTDKIVVVGHTDNSGSYDRNIALSRERAANVKNYLVTKYAIDASRIKSEGAGQFCPVASNASEEGRRRNRRVEIVKL